MHKTNGKPAGKIINDHDKKGQFFSILIFFIIFEHSPPFRKKHMKSFLICVNLHRYLYKRRA